VVVEWIDLQFHQAFVASALRARVAASFPAITWKLGQPIERHSTFDLSSQSLSLLALGIQ